MKITINDVVYEYEKGIMLYDIAKEQQSNYKYDILLAKKDGELWELTKTIEEDSKIEFVTADTVEGNSSYKRSATLILLKALYKIIGRDRIDNVSIQFSISKGYYCTIEGNVDITEELLNQVEKYMREIVEASIPITKVSYPLKEAIKRCREYGMKDKVKLFEYRRASTVNMYKVDDFEDYYYGYMVPDTSYIKYFKLYKFDDGFVMQLPTKENPEQLADFVPQTNVFQVLKESTLWGKSLGAATVGEINDKIVHGEINKLMLVQEAFQEKKIAELAEEIAHRKNVKFVMIAGPSSSGKTTFSHRLSVQLVAKGLKPHPIPVDNYFVNREDNPIDENGNYDFECLEALDVELFNDHMTRLAAGQRVELPQFNFITGQREYHGNYLQLQDNEVLVIEGIHCLNSAMSYAIPEDEKFKIYVSALTQLNIDEHNRIPTTDLRLLRRMVRDMRTRGSSAENTISMWQSVRRGEEKNIFPYQMEADAVFNSALIYEVSVLKQYAEPALFSVPQDSEAYVEAKRLLKFLNYFLSIPRENVPNNSLLREFVGGGCFNV